MQLFRRYALPLLVLTLLVFVILLLRSRTTPVSISSTLPAHEAVKVSLLPTLTLTFAEGPGNTPITLQSDPPFESRLIDVKSNALSFTPTTALTPNTQYIITVLANGHSIYTFRFTTLTPPTDQVLIDNLHQELKDNYPLSSKTPYTTSNYRVIYSAPLTLEITLKNATLSSAQAVAEVKSWVESQGLDPSSHQYLVK